MPGDVAAGQTVRESRSGAPDRALPGSPETADEPLGGLEARPRPLPHHRLSSEQPIQVMTGPRSPDPGFAPAIHAPLIASGASRR